MMVLWHIWEALLYKSISHTSPNPAVLNPIGVSQKPPGTKSKRIEGRQHLARKKKIGKGKKALRHCTCSAELLCMVG